MRANATSRHVRDGAPAGMLNEGCDRIDQRDHRDVRGVHEDHVCLLSRYQAAGAVLLAERTGPLDGRHRLS